MTVGIRMTSSTGASRKRRGRASVRGIGMSTYFVTAGEDGLFMAKILHAHARRVTGPTVGNALDRVSELKDTVPGTVFRFGYFGSDGSMMRNAFRPRPRRSRSSVFIGSKPVRSRIRSKR